MKRLLTILLVLGAWSPAWATEGGDIDTATATGYSGEPSTSSKGSYNVRSFLLCDGATGGATKECGEIDVQQSSLGWPDIAVFQFIFETGCAGAVTVTPIGGDESAMTNTYNLGPTGSTTLTEPAAGVAEQMVVFPVVNRYLAADIGTGTSCTDVEVVLKLFYEQKARR